MNNLYYYYWSITLILFSILIYITHENFLKFEASEEVQMIQGLAYIAIFKKHSLFPWSKKKLRGSTVLVQQHLQ